MKHRIKFRVLQDGGPTGKIAINLEEGEEFAITDNVLGISSEGGLQTHATLSVNQMTVLLKASATAFDLTVNDQPGEEFQIHRGDILSVVGQKLEFVELPEEVEEEEEPNTQTLELADHETLDATGEVSAAVPAPTKVDTHARFSDHEPSLDSIDPAKLEQSQRWQNEDPDLSHSVARKDWRRKAALGALAAVFLGALVTFFALGTRTTGPDSRRLPASMPKAVPPAAEQPTGKSAEEAAAPNPLEEVRKTISDSFVRNTEQSLALINNGVAAQFSLQKAKFFSSVRYGDLETVKKLVSSKQINPATAMESGSTALMQASYYGKIEIVKYLVGKKVPINDQDPYGKSALIYAAQRDQAEVAHFLLSKGADPNLKTRSGETALDTAKKNKSTRALAALKSGKSNGKRAIASQKKKTKKKKKRSRK